MLYDSTKTLLQSILRVLETGDESRWDDQVESGNAFLYEMHQMAGPMYRAYRTDSVNTNSAAQKGHHEKLYRAMPHARSMVIAIRHRDRGGALASGKAALAAMNGVSASLPSACYSEPKTDNMEVPDASTPRATRPGRRRVVIQDAKAPKRMKMASGD
jgi:hypothetical protein